MKDKFDTTLPSRCRQCVASGDKVLEVKGRVLVARMGNRHAWAARGLLSVSLPLSHTPMETEGIPVLGCPANEQKKSSTDVVIAEVLTEHLIVGPYIYVALEGSCYCFIVGHVVWMFQKGTTFIETKESMEELFFSFFAGGVGQSGKLMPQSFQGSE